MGVSLERLRALRKESGNTGNTQSDARRDLARDTNAQAANEPIRLVRHPLASDARSVARDAAGIANVDRADTAISTDTAVSTAAMLSTSVDTTRQQHVASLRRLLGLRERALPAIPAPRATDRALPGIEIAPGLFFVETFLPQVIPTGALSLAFARRDEAIAPSNVLFFDTETTGLAGGTGTRAFMIGAADWRIDTERGAGLRVRQLLIATMAAEIAMLRTFATWFSSHTVLSSYNGRCYDAPLLKTRYRLARLDDPLHGLDHVDLLFPTRRRYRGTWENCRLATIERNLLRIVREDDLPGSEAPAAWLTYLRGGSARNVRRVAAHNHQDVVTLALLMQRLVDAEAEELEVLPFVEAP